MLATREVAYVVAGSPFIPSGEKLSLRQERGETISPLMMIAEESGVRKGQRSTKLVPTPGRLFVRKKKTHKKTTVPAKTNDIFLQLAGRARVKRNTVIIKQILNIISCNTDENCSGRCAKLAEAVWGEKDKFHWELSIGWKMMTFRRAQI